MPQITEVPFLRATYPMLAMTQKPGGVTIGIVLAITGIAWATGVATATTAAHGIPIGTQVQMSITGVTPAGYNGMVLATSASATTFTYPLASSPGAVTVQGQASYVPMASTFVPNPGMAAESIVIEEDKPHPFAAKAIEAKPEEPAEESHEEHRAERHTKSRK